MRTDRRALSQILLNLTNNAIKFTETGLRAARARQPAATTTATIEIRVIDTGIGIKPEDQEKLFKAFTPARRRDRPRPTAPASASTSARSWPSCSAARSRFTSEFGKGSTFILSLPRS